MARYAADTSVSVDRTRTEIEKALQRFGATGFAYGWDQSRAVIGFVLNGRQIRMVLPLPDRGAREFTHTPERGYARTSTDAARAWEAACRASWRALSLILKAKLVAVDAGVVSMEEEFLAWTVLPDGATVGHHALPAVREAYETGQVPSLLPGTTRAIGSGRD
jgi:hypothetical protein